jgi:Ca2+-binding RTX toxin-like protein
MPVISFWDFNDPGTVVNDSETANGAQNGFYQQGAVSVGGEAVLDGCGAYVKLSANETFQMDQGTLAIEFTLGDDPLHHTQTVLSRDSSGTNEGSFRVEILADGSVTVSQETATGTETYTTDPGFANPGDTVSLSYSWDDATPGALVIDNTTTGDNFTAPVPADTTLDMGSLSPHWVIGAGQENSPPGSITGLNQSFQGSVEYFSLSDTVDNVPEPDGYVDGTTDDDLIDLAYTGDPNGDRIDNDDALLPGDAPDDDRVRAGEGDDTVVAGEGDDSVEGSDGDDSLFGGTGEDTLFGNHDDDSLYGGDGDDSLDGGHGSDLGDGGDGDDAIDTSGGGFTPLPDQGYPGLYPSDADPLNDLDTVYGGAGNDTITTGDDADLIDGGADDDLIDAGIDDDTVLGGSGDDTIIGAEGADSIDAGEGGDLVYGGYDPSVPDSVNIPDDAGDLLPLNGNDSILGGAGDDTIFGMDDDDTIDGGADDDLIDAGIDDDLVTGGTGNDTITGGEGEDTLAGGDDRDVFLGGTADDDVDGNEGGDDFDTLDLTGAGPLRVVYDPSNPENGTVEFLDADRNVTGTMQFVNIENVVPCFTPGTLIATPKGEVPVELLQVGDLIITRDNGIQEIRWTGSKALSWADLNLNPHLKPVLIRQGSLGHGLPERDMLVSPNHRMLVANDRTALYFDEHEVLVAAKHLISGNGIHAIDSSGTTYLHFMFDRHEVVLANGAWTESFQPGDMTLKGMGNAQRSEIFDLFPELKSAAGLNGYAAARKTLKRHEALLLVK